MTREEAIEKLKAFAPKQGAKIVFSRNARQKNFMERTVFVVLEREKEKTK